MKLRNILISLIMILSMSACEGEIELKTVLGNDRITINAVVDPDTVVFAFISEATEFDYMSSLAVRADYYTYDQILAPRDRIFRYNSREEKLMLKNANAELIVNDKDVYKMKYDSKYYTYNSEYIPKQGDNIKIRVELLSNSSTKDFEDKLEPVEAEVQLPSTTPRIEVISTELAIKEKEYYEYQVRDDWTKVFTDTYGSDTVMTIRAKIVDPGDEKNFYRLLVRSVGIPNQSYEYLQTKYRCVDDFKSGDMIFYDSDLTKSYGWLPANFSNVFDDELINGKEYEITVETRMRGKCLLAEPYVILELQHLSPDLYYYLKDIEIFRISDFDLYTNPIQIWSNVKGGWGVFGAMTYDTHIIPFER
ncbi:MAG: DUF4249 domain-containing protein [Muribaculaceae bacterium]|nr:DUF4249 domain-containing protein [Muribaculaceae bacterium]